MSKTTLANELSDCCWAAIPLAVEWAKGRISDHACTGTPSDSREKGSPCGGQPRVWPSVWPLELSVSGGHGHFNGVDHWEASALLWMLTGTNVPLSIGFQFASFPNIHMPM